MDEFSIIYEKLIDMGFTYTAIDKAIKKGLYSFDMIFNELVETDPTLISYIDSNNFNKMEFYSSQPTLKLRSSQPSMFDGSIEDKLMETKIFDTTATEAVGMDIYSDNVSSLPPIQKEHRPERKNVEDSIKLSNAMRMEKLYKLRDKQLALELLEMDRNEQHRSTAIKMSKVQSSTLSSSMLSNSTMELSSNKMAKIQIMDLLDPANEPTTYSHPFMSSICTIRDLICWFHQCRSNTASPSVNRIEGANSRIAISSDTSLYLLIELFMELKWHLVLPSGALSMRIYGSEYLDKTLEYIGLDPSAHLLAIISCPLDLRKQSNINSCAWPPCATDQIVSALAAGACCVTIRMINYRHSPLYLQGKPPFTQNYDPDTTTLQRVALDFLSFYQIDDSISFSFLQMQPSRRTFSQPDDYLHTLSELELAGNVTLYCYSSADADDPSSPPNENMSNVSDVGVTNVATIDQFNWRSEPAVVQPSRTPVLPFSGTGVLLSGSHTNRSVAQMWSGRCFSGERESPVRQSRVNIVPRSLFELCLQEIYRYFKQNNSSVCRSVKKLPNNLQQKLIKQLLNEQLLTPNLLSFFCATNSCLTTLDLSYSIAATNEVLKTISKCSSIQELVLDNEDHVFSNEGLWHLRYCTQLTRLSLNYCSRINDWGIQVVGVLPVLSVLAIKYTAVTNVGIKHIYLHLMNSASSEHDAIDLDLNITLNSTVAAICPPLRSLDLSGLSISDESLACIGIFTRLELLNIASTHITDPSLLPPLPELRHLDISNCHELVWDRQAHIRSLHQSFPRLTSINVRGVSNSNLVHLTMAISHCRHLRQIDGILCHPQMTASLATSLSHLPLETIILTNCHHVTDLWLPVIARFSATLTHLVLSSCSSVTADNQSIVNNLSRLRNLSWLDLTHLDNVKSDQICQLVLGKYFPKLQVLWISLTEHEQLHFRSTAKNLHFKVNITRSLVNPVGPEVMSQTSGS